MIMLHFFGRPQGLLCFKLSRKPTCEAAKVHGFKAAVIFRQFGKTLQVPYRLITLAVRDNYHSWSLLFCSAGLLPSNSSVVHWISVR